LLWGILTTFWIIEGFKYRQIQQIYSVYFAVVTSFDFIRSYSEH